MRRGLQVALSWVALFGLAAMLNAQVGETGPVLSLAINNDAADAEEPQIIAPDFGLSASALPVASFEDLVGNPLLTTSELSAGVAYYLPRLKAIFASECVPTELVWMAEVESGFDTLARSPIGAAGLYQLMPDTAVGLGVSVSPVDQRLWPEKNARAAARYLRFLYGQFGDWRLVIAAYNGGEGLVRRLLSKGEAAGYDEIARGLPAETRSYVPRIDEILRKREGTGLQMLAAPKRRPCRS